mgnify:CR=1 FL=1
MKQVVRKIIKETHNISDEKPIYTLLLDMNSIMKMSLVDKRLNCDGLEYGMVYQTLLQIKKQLEKKDFLHHSKDNFMLEKLKKMILMLNLTMVFF